MCLACCLFLVSFTVRVCVCVIQHSLFCFETFRKKKLTGCDFPWECSQNKTSGGCSVCWGLPLRQSLEHKRGERTHGSWLLEPEILGSGSNPHWTEVLKRHLISYSDSEIVEEACLGAVFALKYRSWHLFSTSSLCISTGAVLSMAELVLHLVLRRRKRCGCICKGLYLFLDKGNCLFSSRFCYNQREGQKCRQEIALSVM